MKLSLAVQGKLKDIIDQDLKNGAIATTRGIKTSGEKLKQELRADVVSAGLGNRLSKSWRLISYPLRGNSMSASAVVFTKAPQIIRAFSEGAVIKSKQGKFLAIPTDEAPKKGIGGKRIRPSNFPEHRFGPLRYVKRRGKPDLLVVDSVRITKTGRVGRRLKGGSYTKTGRLKKGVVTVVMFVLVPQVSLPKKLNIDRRGRKAQNSVARNIVKEWDRLDGQ